MLDKSIELLPGIAKAFVRKMQAFLQPVGHQGGRHRHQGSCTRSNSINQAS